MIINIDSGSPGGIPSVRHGSTDRFDKPLKRLTIKDICLLTHDLSRGLLKQKSFFNCFNSF
jgi:hypothetical protein